MGISTPKLGIKISAVATLNLSSVWDRIGNDVAKKSIQQINPRKEQLDNMTMGAFPKGTDFHSIPFPFPIPPLK